MNKGIKPFIEAISLYTVIHALMHILPILTALGVSGHFSSHHGHNHLIQDTIMLTLATHIALPLFTLYATKVKSTHQLNLTINLLHKH